MDIMDKYIACNVIMYNISIMALSIFCKKLIPSKMGGIIV